MKKSPAGAVVSFYSLYPTEGIKKEVDLAEDPRRTDVYRREGLPLSGGIPPGSFSHVTRLKSGSPQLQAATYR